MDCNDRNFVSKLLPDLLHRPNMPIEHKRSVEDFWDVAMTLPKKAAVDTLEYFGWNHGPKKLHHFLCATIKLPRGESQLYVCRQVLLH